MHESYGSVRSGAMRAGAPTPDLEELRTFCTAAELGSLGRAAVRLRVSQPSLSRRLRSLEARAGNRLLDRSAHGVRLTPAGRRLYDHARRLLEVADEVGGVMAAVRRTGRVVRLAASHSSTEAFVAQLLAMPSADRGATVELVTANSQVVRGLVADGRADLGVAASRPHHTPDPGVRETPLVEDAIVCAVPEGHRWASRGHIGLEDFLRTPMVLRDPSSNARWTVEAVLGERGLRTAPPLVEAATPRAALTEARARGAPVLLSRHILAQTPDYTVVDVERLAFPRSYVVVTPAQEEPGGEIAHLITRIREHVRIWLR
jgi:DNA-binding transcriptional LysR family regulator